MDSEPECISWFCGSILQPLLMLMFGFVAMGLLRDWPDRCVPSIEANKRDRSETESGFERLNTNK